ncbi:MAG: helix-turn-helix domain-containing protein [Fusobacterium sp.]|nr:helix-turn-helix domain-containing protein [Fusobacterium sp.]
MNLKENLGKNIHKYRKLKGITQEKLAEMIDVEINSISSIERGRFFPSPDNLVKITNALEVSFSDLFTFIDEYSCQDYEQEILKNLALLKNDKTKLNAINTFIKSIL